MTFLLSEDNALRDLLKGITVTDQKSDDSNVSHRKVEVWFGQPDQELRDQKYPYITIDMIDISEDVTRAMRGLVKPAYLDNPETVDGNPWIDDDHNWLINFPIPVNIDYQVTVYSRQPRHDREILAQLVRTRLPLRFGSLQTDDDTVRRLDVLDISKRDISEAGKRLFVNAFTVRISSEIAPALLDSFYKVKEVHAIGANVNSLTPIDSFTITE
jgi:hypothetical protein